MSSLEVPVYNKKETINQYMKRVEKYTMALQQEKYNTILEFVNLWIGAEYTSLSEFKNIPETILLKNAKHNRDTVRKYSDIFQSRFEIDLRFGIETDSDEINDRYIIYLLIKMLNIINYTLIRRELGKKTLYSIRKK